MKPKEDLIYIKSNYNFIIINNCIIYKYINNKTFYIRYKSIKSALKQKNYIKNITWYKKQRQKDKKEINVYYC